MKSRLRLNLNRFPRSLWKGRTSKIMQNIAMAIQARNYKRLEELILNAKQQNAPEWVQQDLGRAMVAIRDERRSVFDNHFPEEGRCVT